MNKRSAVLVSATFLAALLLVLGARLSLTIKVQSGAELNRARSVNYPSQDELVLVYIGSPDCAASRQPELPELMERAVRLLAVQAERSGQYPTAIGVIVSSRVDRGLEYLRAYPYLNEIVVGNSWRNSGILRYLAGENAGPLAIPQIVVLSRRRSDGGVGVEDEVVVLRRVGVPAITRWVEGGASGFQATASQEKQWVSPVSDVASPNRFPTETLDGARFER
jgi:hypothetical protein